jgi:Sulfotransferase family
MSHQLKCVIILSTKSAGSSALQELICRHTPGRHVTHTRHAQHETLYWTKAASVLGLPQERIPGSEVPIPPARALSDLKELLTQNIPDFSCPAERRELIFEGWRRLCRQHGPLFVEKSPHHLHQPSALRLMREAERELPEVGFRYVGLVRNPMDALYSMWDRRRDDLVQYQVEWQAAYENLLAMREQVGERMFVVRYEDLSKLEIVNALFEFIGCTATSEAQSFIHSRSRQKWKSDRWFGLQLAPAVMALAKHRGYQENELHNDTHALWPMLQKLGRYDPRYIQVRWRHTRRWLSGMN